MSKDVDVDIDRSVPGNVYRHITGRELQIIVFFKLKAFVDDDGKCKKACKNKATCLQWPFSVKEECQCPEGYDGDFCESRSTTNFTSTLHTILSATAQVPQLTDIYFGMEDVKEDIQNGFGAVQQSLKKMTQIVSRKIDMLSIDMTNLFEQVKFGIKYTGAIRQIKNHIRSLKPIFNEFLKNGQGEEAINKAKRLLFTEKIPSWEYDLQDLLQGSSTPSKVQPYMILVMNSHKKKVERDGCSDEYKELIDSTRANIMDLQKELFILHVTALRILGKDSRATTIGIKYKGLIKNQVCMIQNHFTLQLNSFQKQV